MTAIIEIPTDRPRKGSRGGKCANVDTPLEGALFRDVVATAAKHAVKASVVLLATWAVLVHRLSGQSGLLTGVATDTPMLPLHLDLLPSMTVGECLVQVDAQLRAAQAHGGIASDEKAGASDMSPGDSQAWQLSFDARPDRLTAVDGISSELAMKNVGAGEAIDGLEYATALFDAGTAQRYLGYWCNLLGLPATVFLASPTPAAPVAALYGKKGAALEVSVRGHDDRTEPQNDPFAGGPFARVIPTTEPQREIWLVGPREQPGKSPGSGS